MYVPLKFIGEFLVTLYFPHSFGGIIGLWMVFSLIVYEHSNELIVHNLHVHLKVETSDKKVLLLKNYYLALLEWL